MSYLFIYFFVASRTRHTRNFPVSHYKVIYIFHRLGSVSIPEIKLPSSLFLLKFGCTTVFPICLYFLLVFIFFSLLTWTSVEYCWVTRRLSGPPACEARVSFILRRLTTSNSVWGLRLLLTRQLLAALLRRFYDTVSNHTHPAARLNVWTLHVCNLFCTE